MGASACVAPAGVRISFNEHGNSNGFLGRRDGGCPPLLYCIQQAAAACGVWHITAVLSFFKSIRDLPPCMPHSLRSLPPRLVTGQRHPRWHLSTLSLGTCSNGRCSFVPKRQVAYLILQAVLSSMAVGRDFSGPLLALADELLSVGVLLP